MSETYECRNTFWIEMLITYFTNVLNSTLIFFAERFIFMTFEMQVCGMVLASLMAYHLSLSLDTGRRGKGST